MKKYLLLFILAVAPLMSVAQEVSPSVPSETPTVTIASRGLDVRAVVHDLFVQVKKNYVLDQKTPRIDLFLSLTNLEFEEALELICAQSGLTFTVQNGIYFLVRKAPVAPVKLTKAAPITPTKPTPAPPKVVKLTDADLQKRITTRLPKTPLKDVMAALSQQTGFTIEIDPATPEYKLDAFLVDTSLKYALDVITKATSLEYVLTPNRTILIRPAQVNHVTVVNP